MPSVKTITVYLFRQYHKTSFYIRFGKLGDNFSSFRFSLQPYRRAFLEILYLRQDENTPPEIEMQVIQRHGPHVPPTASEAFSRTVVNQEPVLLSFRCVQAEEIIPLDEADKHLATLGDFKRLKQNSPKDYGDFKRFWAT